MLGTTKRRPVDAPFPHSPDCKMQKVAPAWTFLPGTGGQWERACRCHIERVTVLDEAIDPASSAAEPSWQAAEHNTACHATEVEQVVKIEKRDGGWRATCLACTWVTVSIGPRTGPTRRAARSPARPTSCTSTS
jgi:hypothetical protein